MAGPAPTPNSAHHRAHSSSVVAIVGRWETEEQAWRLAAALEVIGFDAEEGDVEIVLVGPTEPSSALRLMMGSLHTDARVSYRKVCRGSAPALVGDVGHLPRARPVYPPAAGFHAEQRGP